MTRQAFFSLLTVAALLLLGSPDVEAQRTSPDIDRSGTTGATYLMLPLTARSASLGTAVTGGVNDMNGLEASFHNPAGLNLNDGTGVLFSRMSYVADIGVNYFGVSQQFSNNSVGLTVSSWDFGDIPEQTVENPEIIDNRTWSATYVTVGLSYARMFTDRISAGITTKVISESMADDMSANGIAFDAGMNYLVGDTGLRFGVALKNFGPALKYAGDGLVREAQFQGERQTRTATIRAANFELPSLLNFGVSYTYDVGASSALTVLSNFRSNANSRDQFSGGLELNLRDLLSVRGGYQWQENIDDRNFYKGWNVGAGLNLEFQGNRLAVDYAYRAAEFFSNIQLITASVTL
jgi:hypothetical protein